MIGIKKKYVVKIPHTISVFYCSQKKIVVLNGPLEQKFLKLEVEIFLMEKEKLIQVSCILVSNTPNNTKKTNKALQGTTVAQLKQIFAEVSSIFYHKLKFIGVGYRVFNVENYKNKLLLLNWVTVIQFTLESCLNCSFFVWNSQNFLFTAIRTNV